MAIKTFSKLRRMEEHSDNINKGIKNMKKNQSELENTITEMKNTLEGTLTLSVQLLRLHVSTAGDKGLISGQGTKIPHAMQCNQKK